MLVIAISFTSLCVPTPIQYILWISIPQIYGAVSFHTLKFTFVWFCIVFLWSIGLWVWCGFFSITHVKFYSTCVYGLKNKFWRSAFGRVFGCIYYVNILKLLKCSLYFHCLRIFFSFILSNFISDIYFCASKQYFPLTCRPICPVHDGWSRNRNFTIYWFPTT